MSYDNVYNVVEYKNGDWNAVVSGLGKNRGTWDSAHSRSSAYRLAKQLNEVEKDDTLLYKVEHAYYND